ncbi:hypothetical protein SEA_MASHLEY_79 [Microbacterium phage Mashley]|uniref:Lipoprotein n=1 Tax=Microbacterium phage Hyperion TaxID=2182354 RepID=A0A2U8UIV3_9CAUD|nr:hypothetical protein HOT27_gp077 [Microbacterium phage Hyperion]QED11895.1 hypothetical protein SEA_MASHLEY_79 [Microbacterium phage Mashley]QXN74001.1 hypothetical protein SEA_BLAB_75 [Microbacterium phage Blab]UJD20810.1 hypothetical protein SEA_ALUMINUMJESUS_75 [Microbacterium phage AluminumJesus]UVG34448.1 hypothetical protein SEA_GAZEBO_79 [Microbacterium phage Gazebo]AWN03592.1 hypothetical protein PBI_HYPERION_77 [Microbacterium phage Hyperion]
MKLRAVAALAALALALTGCSAINSGTITAKVIEPAHTTISTTCVPVGKVIVCTPNTIYDDEDYRFDLRNEDETGYVYVDRTTFDQYDEGDFYG